MKVICAIVGEVRGAFEVNIGESASVSALKDAIKKKKWNESKYIDAKNLKLFLAKKNDEWLKDDNTLDVVLQNGDMTSYKRMRGAWNLNNKELLGPGFRREEGRIHVMVVIPPQVAPQDTLPSAEGIPAFIPLDNWKKYMMECSLDRWKAGQVRNIPLIWQFMEPLGGCTRRKKIFWREEDKQVASILLDRFFDEPADAFTVSYADMKSILVGSSGIGKSTLFIVMAFFLVFKHMKNVLVYRQLSKADQDNCLLYLGYQGGEIVYFTKEKCKPEVAESIYDELDERQGSSNVWLLLDGFQYDHIPKGLRTFRMLVTSQQADLKGSESDYAYRCLLPCWKKQDLFALGRGVYEFEEQDMERRYFYSGGSVREFAKATKNNIKDMQDIVAAACARTKDMALFADGRDIQADNSHIDRLRHTFVMNTRDPDNYLICSYWKHLVDSEYAVLLLSRKGRSSELLRLFHWARGAGHNSLARTLFEICLHRLAIGNDLILRVSECNPYKQNKKRKMDTIWLKMNEGKAFCSDTATKGSYDEDELDKWRDDETLSYWYSNCDNFPNIDGIVKLKPSSPDKKSRVAVLHLTVRQKHSVDEKQLETLRKLFTAEDFDPPVFIVLGPDFEASNNIVVKRGPQRVKTCQVFVGCYDEHPLECNDDDWRDTRSREEEKPSESYELLPRKQPRLN